MKIKNIFYCIIFVLLLSSCEDPVPKDYIPSNIVEALLIVNEPIRNIKILKSQSLFDEFSYDSSLVSDAEVYIIDDNNNILELFTMFKFELVFFFISINKSSLTSIL